MIGMALQFFFVGYWFEYNPAFFTLKLDLGRRVAYANAYDQQAPERVNRIGHYPRVSELIPAITLFIIFRIHKLSFKF